MSACHVALLLAACLAGPRAARQERPVFVVEHAKIELGEPFLCRLVVAHAATERASMPDGLATDESWIMLEDRGARSVTDPADPERATTTFVWELCSLEPGERELAGPFVTVDPIEPGVTPGRVVQAAPLVLNVRPALYPEEDAPRSLAGFPASSLAQPGGFPWLAVILAVLALAAAVTLWRRRRRTEIRAPEPLASAQLAALADGPLDTPEAVQHALYTASHLVRARYDRAFGGARDGLTDEEWLAAVGPELSRRGLDGDDLAQLARACEAVKYGSERPTHWAARETLALARALAVRVESAERVA